MTFEELVLEIRRFAVEREWEQFHTPKNLAMALAGEAGELLAELQWLTPEQSMAMAPPKRAAVAAEMADVLIYLCRMSDVLGVDLLDAAQRKLQSDAARYAVEDVKGSAEKRR